MDRRPELRKLWIFPVLLVIASGAATLLTPGARAAGAWNGQDLLHVPMAWCILQGSPAQAAPDILGLNGTRDTDTDAVIWRRHERPTDNIYVPQAGISLRSAINNAWGSFNFPILTDTNTTNGTVGDVNGWNVNVDGAEFTGLITACDQAYDAIGRAGIGVTAVNIGLFHDNANSANDGNTQWDYVGTIGWGGCYESPPGTCSSPYNGRIMVIDNHYLYPTVPDRTFPPSPADLGGNLRFIITDSLDQLTGHETGHSLSLDHRNNLMALMNPVVTDNSGDGDSDNIALNATEVAAVRANALNVPGLETDPPGEFIPGNFVGMRLMDTNPRDDVPPYLNLASVNMVLDRGKRRLHLGQELMGLVPRLSPKMIQAYGFLVDSDGQPGTGCSAAQLERLGFGSGFEGADLLATAVIVRDSAGALLGVTGEVSACSGDVLLPLSKDLFRFELQTLRMHPHFARISDQRPIRKDFTAEVSDMIALAVANGAQFPPVEIGKPARVQAMVLENGVPRDRLDDSGAGRIAVLELPSFPHCFPQADGRPGGTVPVRFDGLLPNREIHALLGPDLVLEGAFTDANGAGLIDLPIPGGTRSGPHLVTIGHDKLALTADCTVNVQECPPGAIVMSMPENVSGRPGTSAVVPVNLSDVTGQGVIAAEATVLFDPSVLRAVQVSLGAVTASSRCSVVPNLGMPDRAVIAVFCELPMAGAGSLVDITFEVLGCSGSPLDIAGAMLNEGNPPVCTRDGQLTSCAGISGRVSYYRDSATGTEPSGKPVNEAKVDLTGFITAANFTGCDGSYAFPNVPAGESHRVTPHKLDDTGPAADPSITAFDAAINAQDVVGIVNPPFTPFTPHQDLAADVSGNGSNSAFDSALMAQFAVGLITKFPVATPGTDWTFVPRPQPEPNQTVTEPVPSAGVEGSISFTPLVESAENQDFLAILYGDVTGNWMPRCITTGGGQAASAQVLTQPAQASAPAAGTQAPIGRAIRLALPTLTAVPGELIRVPVQVRDVGEAIAFDLDLRFDPGVLRARQVEAGEAASGFNLASNVQERGRARIALFDAQPVRRTGDLVVVTFEVVGRPGARTALTLAASLINEGRIGASVKDGSLLVRAGR